MICDTHGGLWRALRTRRHDTHTLLIQCHRYGGRARSPHRCICVIYYTGDMTITGVRGRHNRVSRRGSPQEGWWRKEGGGEENNERPPSCSNDYAHSRRSGGGRSAEKREEIRRLSRQ